MKDIFMTAGVLTAIILCFVGLIKLPFSKFKANKPEAYKATFTGVSIVITIGFCLIDQLLIVKSTIISMEFAVLLTATFSGVFGLYNSYEGLGVKTLVNRLVVSIKKLRAISPENKLLKNLDKVDVNKLIELLQEAKSTEPKVIETNSTEEPKPTNIE